VLARALDRPEQAVEVALEVARQARKAGDLPNAMSALHNIKRAAGMCATTYVSQTSDMPCCVQVIRMTKLLPTGCDYRCDGLPTVRSCTAAKLLALRKGCAPCRSPAVLGPDQTVLWQIEEAKVLWAQGQRAPSQRATAARMARGLVQGSQQGVSADTRARLLCLAAKWLGDTM